MNWWLLAVAATPMRERLFYFINFNLSLSLSRFHSFLQITFFSPNWLGVRQTSWVCSWNCSMAFIRRRKRNYLFTLNGKLSSRNALSQCQKCLTIRPIESASIVKYTKWLFTCKRLPLKNGHIILKRNNDVDGLPIFIVPRQQSARKWENMHMFLSCLLKLCRSKIKSRSCSDVIWHNSCIFFHFSRSLKKLNETTKNSTARSLPCTMAMTESIFIWHTPFSI